MGSSGNESLTHDGAGLQGFLKLMLERKVLIIVVAALTIGLVAVLNAVTPPIYTSEAQFALRLKMTYEDAWLSVPDSEYTNVALSDRVLDGVRRAIDDAPGDGTLRGHVYEIKLKPDSRLVEARARASSPELAQRYLEAWHDAYTTELRALFGKLIDARLALLEIEIKALEESRGGSEAWNASDPTPTYFDLALNTELVRKLTNARIEREQLSYMAKQLPELVPLEILIAPKRPSAPTSPKKSVNLSLAAVIGLLLGVGAAIVSSTWQGETQGETLRRDTPD